MTNTHGLNSPTEVFFFSKTPEAYGLPTGKDSRVPGSLGELGDARHWAMWCKAMSRTRGNAC